ncbi:hypothetical protein WJR50_02720 [Catalinimonas sp. 4WD22]|uniref:hypothetical protein n=1 Tax=Catalinimonas locisalis TaxID=3133978 RepID=UPI003100C43D
MNLQDELIYADSKRQQRFLNDNSIAELQEILRRESKQEKQALQHMGLFTNTIEPEKEHWLRQALLNQKYEGEVFHVDDIRQVCMAYNMRMLPSHLYRGPIDTQFAPRVKNFQRTYHLSDEEVAEDFVIVAPGETFELEERQRPLADLDPILLYRVDDHFYKLVHQWGGELNVFRYISSWKKRDLWNMTCHWFVMSFMVTMILLGFLVDGLSNAVTLSLLISGLIAWMYYSSFRDSPDELRHRFSRYNWNQKWTY